MTTTLPSFVINTYTKTIIANYSTLNRIIFQRTSTIKDQLKIDTDKNEINSIPVKTLSNQRMNDALNGPFSRYLKSFMRAYGTLAHLKQQLVQSSDDIFKKPISQDDDEHRINQKALKKTSKNECEKINDELGALMKKADDAWSDFVNEQCSVLLEGLATQGLEITDSDSQDFNNLYTISELVERLNHLNIDAKLSSPDSQYDFQQYFSLKCKLMFYSVLSRQHKKAEEKELSELVDRLKSALKNIYTSEMQLLAQYEKEIEAILQPIAFAKIKSS